MYVPLPPVGVNSVLAVPVLAWLTKPDCAGGLVAQIVKVAVTESAGL